MTLHWTACLLVAVYQVCCDVYSCFTFLYLLLMYEIYSILIQFVVCWKSCTSVYLCEHDVLLSHNINHQVVFHLEILCKSYCACIFFYSITSLGHCSQVLFCSIEWYSWQCNKHGLVLVYVFCHMHAVCMCMHLYGQACTQGGSLGLYEPSHIIKNPCSQSPVQSKSLLRTSLAMYLCMTIH